ncbi:MAG: glycosyltransferase family 4 protein [Anaerolineales bacterium]
MKIAYCLPDQQWIDEMRGGAPKDAAHIQQMYIANGLHARGHSITYLAPRDLLETVTARDSDELVPAPQTWTSSAWFDLISKIAWRFQQLLGISYLNVFSNLRRENACVQILPGHDVAFERNSLYNIGVARACKKLHIPYVIFFDADQIAELDYMGTPLKGLLRWHAQNLLRENLAAAKRIVCVSEPSKKHLMDAWNVPAEKIKVLSNAVDIHRFRPDPDLRTQTRASLSLTSHPLVVFVGSFYQWHDIATLLDSFAVVLKSNPDARLVLVGDGTEREKMMQRAADLKIADVVTFTGFVTYAEVSRYVNAADIAVVPMPAMKQEMWLSPMKLFEYMASGKAVIASAMGQIVNVIRDGENGLLVPAGDVQVLANAINRLTDEPELREKLGKQAREDAVQNHSWEQYLSCMEQILADVTTGSSS